MFKLEYPNFGSADLQIKVMNAICGDVADKTLIDLCCGEAPQTGLMPFKEKTYVDVVNRTLPYGQTMIQSDVFDFLKQAAKDFSIYDVAICTDAIEHFREKEAVELVLKTAFIAKQYIFFTPLGEYCTTYDINCNNPDSHKSGWTPELVEEKIGEGFAHIVFPNWHPTLSDNGLGAFFFWKSNDTEGDFKRVEQILNQL